MNATQDFDRLVASWLEADGPTDVQADVVEAALELARSTPRPGSLRAWLVGPGTWPVHDRRPSFRGASPTIRLVILVALLATASAAVALVGSMLLHHADSLPHVYSGVLEPGGFVRRDGAVAFPLADGRILVGGFSTADGSLAEVFDPSTARSQPIRFAGRNDYLMGARQLPDGEVLLIVWIYGDPAALGRSVGYLYDPSTGAVRPTAAMTARRFEPAMATLADGRVLISGGLPHQESQDALATAEIYDRTSNTFIPTGAMGVPRFEHALTPLDDGTVLVSGGFGVTTGEGVPNFTLERYDPMSGTFLPAGAVAKSDRQAPVAPVVLSDGRILLWGGSEMRCGRHGIDPMRTYLFDPSTGGITESSLLPHEVRTATLLDDGRVLLSGHWSAVGPAPGGCAGNGGNVTDDWLGIYDPATGVTLASLDPFTGVSTLAADPDKPYAAAAALTDGRVALIDGDGSVDIFR